MASKAPGPELRIGADFRKSLQRVFDEAKDKNFGTHKHFREITASILGFLAARRTMTEAQACASCRVRLPDGRAASTRVALPPQNLNLSGETLQRLRRVDTDREFLGIILAAQYEQMAKKQQVHSSGGGSVGRGERRKKRRARDILMSSPDQQSPVKKTRKNKAAAAAAPPQSTQQAEQAKTAKTASPLSTSFSSLELKKNKGIGGGHDGPAAAASPLTTVQAKSEELQTAVLDGSDRNIRSVQKPLLGQTGRSNKEEGSSETILPDRTTEWTLKSGRKVQISTRSSKCSTPSRTTASSAALALPQTPKQRRRHDSDSDDSASESEEDAVPTSNATSLMDIDNQEGGDDDDYDDDNDNEENDADAHQSLTSDQKLAKDIARVLQSLSRTTKRDTRWADKPAMLEWLTLRHQQLCKQTGADLNADDPDSPSGRIARLDNIARHMPDKLDALDLAKRATCMAELRKLCRSALLPSMDYEQRLLRIVSIVYLEEEIDAVAGREWTRLEQVLGLCSIIAEAIGPQDETIDEERKNRWILARKMDIASLKTLMAAKERCEGLGL
ncbi:hypothetical protein E4U55_002861 [Claviceps digitariae]|nr:hypothetical protein E4U55_002861 [Claviceps digitariae]